MSESSISPRVKFGLLGAVVIVGLVAIANMNASEPSHTVIDHTDSSSAPDADSGPGALIAPQDQPAETHQERHVTTEKIAWNTSLAKGMEEAKKSHKLVMVDVFTDWCEWCKVMDGTVHSKRLPATFNDSEVVKESKKFVAVKANATNDHTLEMRYRFSTFPMVLWLDGDGKLISFNDGYIKPEYFVTLMHQARRKYADVSGA